MINFPNPSSMVGAFRALPFPSLVVGGVVLAVMTLAIGIFKIFTQGASEKKEMKAIPLKLDELSVLKAKLGEAERANGEASKQISEHKEALERLNKESLELISEQKGALESLKNELSGKNTELATVRAELDRVKQGIQAEGGSRSSDLGQEVQKLDLSWIEQKLRELDADVLPLIQKIEASKSVLEEGEKTISALSEKLEMERDFFTDKEGDEVRTREEKIAAIPGILKQLDEALAEEKAERLKTIEELSGNLTRSEEKLAALEAVHAKAFSNENSEELEREIERQCAGLIDNYSSKMDDRRALEYNEQEMKVYRNQLIDNALGRVSREKQRFSEGLEQEKKELESSMEYAIVAFEVFENLHKGVSYLEQSTKLALKIEEEKTTLAEFEKKKEKAQKGVELLKTVTIFFGETAAV